LLNRVFLYKEKTEIEHTNAQIRIFAKPKTYYFCINISNTRSRNNKVDKQMVEKFYISWISGILEVIELLISNQRVHHINYLQKVKTEYHDSNMFGDREYIGKEIRLDLPETAKIKMHCPYGFNQNDREPQFVPFAKARKRIETVFSQLNAQFLLIRNDAKETEGMFARAIGNISAFVFYKLINKVNNNLIGRVKYALI